MIKDRHYQVSKVQYFSFRNYCTHKLALTDKFSAIQYRQGQVHAITKRQNLPILGILVLSLTEQRCGSKEAESDDGRGIGMESCSLYWNRRDGSLYVLKSKPFCNDLGDSASSALSGLYVGARLLLKTLFSFT